MKEIFIWQSLLRQFLLLPLFVSRYSYVRFGETIYRKINKQTQKEVKISTKLINEWLTVQHTYYNILATSSVRFTKSGKKRHHNKLAHILIFPSHNTTTYYFDRHQISAHITRRKSYALQRLADFHYLFPLFSSTVLLITFPLQITVYCEHRTNSATNKWYVFTYAFE